MTFLHASQELIEATYIKILSAYEALSSAKLSIKATSIKKRIPRIHPLN